MSTIGTTLKEPRVFAHDAIALADLTGYPPTPAATFTIIDGGTDYTAATVYGTASQGGREANINVVAVGAGGVVTSVNLAGGDGGRNYTVGDRLTLIGGTSNNDCILEVATVAATGVWALSDPIVAPRSTFNTVSYWNEKTMYTYTIPAPYTNQGTFTTPGPGAALYVGKDMDITVVNEACTIVEYKGVKAGSFLPVSVLSVIAKTDPTELDTVLALF